MVKDSKISLTSSIVEEELKRVNYKIKYRKLLKSTIFALIVASSVATLIASFVLSLFEINGSSMAPTLEEGQIVIAFKDKTIDQGDVIAFYQGNKILVKRVLARAGSFVNIDDAGNVYVDGKIVKETYIDDKSMGNSDIEYPYQVPDGHYFVLGDKRDTSLDSRNSLVGAVAKEDIIGKVKISVWPINKLEIIK